MSRKTSRPRALSICAISSAMSVPMDHPANRQRRAGCWKFHKGAYIILGDRFNRELNVTGTTKLSVSIPHSVFEYQRRLLRTQ